MRTNSFLKKLLTAFLSLWQIGFLYAQDVRLIGKVTNGNENLSGATVSLGHNTTLTNVNGEFSFSIKPGNYSLIISNAGYKRIEETVSFDAGILQTLTYNLTPIKQMGEVVVLGSRSFIQRSNLKTPVAIDVFPSAGLQQTGQASLTQMLNLVSPSFNVSRENSSEATTLRGLDPQHVLILLNGIRYHNTVGLHGRGLKGPLGAGSVGNNLNTIPFSAIEKVEILRDGASAQYGSDAIAGVINIQLKKSTGKTSIRLHTGQFYEGDGEKFAIEFNRGISVFKKGFLNFSANYIYQAPTVRGGEYAGTVYKNYPSNASVADSLKIKVLDDSIIRSRGFNRKNAVDNVGNSKMTRIGLLVNGGYPIRHHTEVFWTATISRRRNELENPYRFPKTPLLVNLSLFPDGLQPIGMPTSIDVSGIAGIKGTTDNNWHWDVRSSYGFNSVIGRLINANNASQSYLSANAQTSFDGGKNVYKLMTNDMNFVKRYSTLPGLVKNLNIGLGAEWRFEKYATEAGEEASWKNYDTLNYPSGGTGGSTDTANDVAKHRNVWGIYIEIESEFSEKFLINVATRYEYYSDFGGNFAAKVAARYKFSQNFSLRASVNNGFRAPSLQQRWLKSVSQFYLNTGQGRIALMRGTFPNSHDLVSALGVPLLSAEKTINISAGFTSTILNQINLTLDAYWIQIKDRIVLGGALDKSIPAVKTILDNFSALRVDQIQFFSNAINTRTKGIDVVAEGDWKIHKANLGINLAFNFTSTQLFGDIKTSHKLSADSMTTNKLFNIEDITRVEKGQPGDKIILAIILKTGRLKWLLRNTRFGSTAIATVFLNPTRILSETFSSKILTDINMSYSLKKWVSITTGVNNVFNVYPDRLKYYENTVQGSRIYSAEASPFGFNGGYYYVGIAFKW